MAETVKNDVDPESKFKKFMGILFDKPIEDDDGNQTGVQRGLLTGIGRGLVGYSQGLKGNVVDYSNEDAEINLAYQRLAQERKDKAAEAEFQKVYADYLKGITPGGALPGNPISGSAPIQTQPIGTGLSPIAFKGIGGIPQAQYGVTGISPTGLNIGQTPESKAQFDIATEVIKQEAKEQAKKERTIGDALPATKRFIENVVEVQGELKEKFPKIGESTYGGLISRIGAAGLEKTGTLPKTSAFLTRLEVIANNQAREIEGGRITDQDRAVYSKAMANALRLPDEANTILAREALLDLKAKGGDIDPIIKEFKASGVDFLESIANQIDKPKDGFIKHKSGVSYRVIGE